MREKDYNYEYPIRATRYGEEMFLRKMRKDELPDDNTHTWYCRVDGMMFRDDDEDYKIV